jgi:putative SOS response-associated peptidase YedK
VGQNDSTYYNDNMCNRYQLKAKPDELIDLFDLPCAQSVGEIAAEFFPGKPVPVVYQDRDARQFQHMTWGFPPWRGRRPINNTRSEKAASSTFWSQHVGHRCVFPISAAVEWQHQINTTTGELRKVPHIIHFHDNRIGVVAGIYSADQGAPCCSMMTCRANRLWASIHNANPDDPRMVCFLLDTEVIEAWLDPNRPYEAACDLLGPVPDEPSLLVARPLVGPPENGVDEGSLFG